MDPFTNPQRAASFPGRGLRGPLGVTALILAMVAASIAGSAYFRPEPRTRDTLQLGGATPVRLAPRAAADTIANVLEALAPSVAFLTIPELARSGSGVVVHEAGFVVTNAHVVEGVEHLLVAFDDEEYEAEVWGVDRATDLAVVKVSAGEALPAAALGDSDALQVGEFVLALGAPFGLEATATSGIVSGLHRNGLGIARFEDFIVTDAPINRGNSGGPLVNLRGEVVGINTAIIAGEDNPHNLGTFAGVGFAIPVNVMRVVAQRLIGDGGLAPAGVDGAAGGGAEAGERGGPGSTVGGGREAVMPKAGRGVAVADGAAVPGSPRRLAPLRTALAVASQPPPAAAAAAVAASVGVGYVKVFDANGRARSNGTGFLLDDGSGVHLITNAHVLRNAAAVEVLFPGNALREEISLTGTVVVTDVPLDLALVDLPPDPRLVPLRLADGNHPSLGDPITALGARLDDNGSVHTVANTGEVRQVDGVELPGVARAARKIATTIAVEQGDSGGPVLNAAGEVVAVVVARDNRDTVAEDGTRRSYAVLLRREQEFSLLTFMAADPGFDVGFNKAVDLGVIAVVQLQDGGMADRLGHESGDRIVAVDGEVVPADQFEQHIWWMHITRRAPGDEFVVAYERKNDADEWVRHEITWTVPPRGQVP